MRIELESVGVSERGLKIGAGQAMRFIRTCADGRERIAFIGFIERVIEEGDNLQVKLYAPEKLVTDRGGPAFPPPMVEHASAPQVFDFWWKQFDYVFALPNPRRFPRLPTALSEANAVTIRRYIRVARELARSGVLNALSEGFNMQKPEGPHGIEQIEQRFTSTDLQVGFAALLRQCDSPEEAAGHARVHNILWLEADAAQDVEREARLDQLRLWSSAIKRLHKKSLNQLLRDKLVAEGVRTLDFEEEHAPTQLLSVYNYGELLHWGDKRDVVEGFETDEFVDSDRRLAYLEAAGALGYLYVGFGELARAATGEME